MRLPHRPDPRWDRYEPDPAYWPTYADPGQTITVILDDEAPRPPELLGPDGSPLRQRRPIGFHADPPKDPS